MTKQKLIEILTDNLSYKLVALFIALILWFTILGRRDFVLSKSFEVELLTGPSQMIVNQSAEFVKVKFSGPRTALKKFLESGAVQLITLDVSKQPNGRITVEIPTKKIDVPFGVKVVSVRPDKISAEIQTRE
jgi:hypothetical protein